jgi:hypothetical protein
VQLGNDTLAVRLSGIYALERITHDSPRDRDEATIVEVPSAFVRVHSDPLYGHEQIVTTTRSCSVFRKLTTPPLLRM